MDRLKLDGILEGTIKEQGTPDATLQTIGLVVVKGGQRTVITDGNLTITANSSGDPRVDLIEWDGNALSVVAGTAATLPASPSPTAGSIPICGVFVPDSFTEVRNLNYDFINAEAAIISLYNAVGGLFAQRNNSSQVTISSATESEQTGTMLPLYIPRTSFGYRIRHHLLVQNENTVATKSALKVLTGVGGVHDAVNLPNQGYVTMTARDSGFIELYSLEMTATTGDDESLAQGPLRLSSMVGKTQAGSASGKITKQWLAVEEIR